MTVKCHYDGRVFVPDEPVDLPAGQAASVALADREAEAPDQAPSAEPAGVEFTGGPGGTFADLLDADVFGGWSGYTDECDDAEFNREFRLRRSKPSYHKQRAFLDLYEDWDERRRAQAIADDEAAGAADGGEAETAAADD